MRHPKERGKVGESHLNGAGGNGKKQLQDNARARADGWSGSETQKLAVSGVVIGRVKNSSLDKGNRAEKAPS